MTDSRMFALSARHVTVSTVGVTDKIRALARDAPTARLALSLHAPTQQLRERIVPSAKAYKLPALLGAVQDYVEATGNRVFVEYVMLRGVNDEAEHAQQLADVLADLPVTVNLIPWNPVLSPDISFEAPGLERVRPCCICTVRRRCVYMFLCRLDRMERMVSRCRFRRFEMCCGVSMTSRAPSARRRGRILLGLAASL